MPESADGFPWPACLARVRAGDEDAARELLAALHPLVSRIVHGHRPRRETAEDLTQNVLTHLFTNLHRYEGRAPFPHWASRVAVNFCLKALRAEKARPEWRLADLSEGERLAYENREQPDEGNDAAASVASRDLVEKLLDGLSPADRLVVTMLHLEGRSVAEIQAATGWNAVVVKVRAFRARQKLRKIFDQLESSTSDPCPSPMIRSLAC